ncbi:MAG: hypothetical protein KUG69_00600 [Marinosulfonomonas sp.]|nr:hypothetical protein [Marinosulfonomonas sp.]
MSECSVVNNNVSFLKAEARFSVFGADKALLHLRAGNSGDLKKMQGYLGGASSIRVLVTTINPDALQTTQELRASTFELVPRSLSEVSTKVSGAATVTRKHETDYMSGLTLDQIEKIAVEAAIEQNKGSVPKAARSLAVSPSTLYRKLENWRKISA